MWPGIINVTQHLCLLPEPRNLLYLFFLASTNCDFLWDFLLLLSVGHYSEPFFQDHRHKEMNTDCHLNLSRTADIHQALEAIVPHPKMLPMTWRHHLFFPIPTILFKTYYLWAFPPSSKLCTPAQSSVSTGWSNPTPFQTSELCRSETSPCSASHLKSLLFSPEEPPCWLSTTVHFTHWFYYSNHWLAFTTVSCNV